MNARKVSMIVALGLSMASGLCFVAGSPGFQMMSRAGANFAGIAVGSAAALAWIAAGMIRSQEKSAPAKDL